MRNKKNKKGFLKQKCIFVLITTILIISVLFVHDLFNINYKQTLIIQDLERERQEFIIAFKALNITYDETLPANIQLENHLNYIQALEKENELLFTTLASIQNTYNVAVNSQGAEMPILTPSGFTAEMFEKVWKHYNAIEMYGSGKLFVKAEVETGINALILASIAVHESAWGTSKLARHKDNYFGWGAFDQNPYHYASRFDSRKDCILHVAKQIKDLYLTKGGRYYRGNNLNAMQINYASGKTWSEEVAEIMKIIAEIAVDAQTLFLLEV